jgi:hypothetical protein
VKLFLAVLTNAYEFLWFFHIGSWFRCFGGDRGQLVGHHSLSICYCNLGAATITITDGSPADTVKISIPKSESGSSSGLFGRLQVAKP